MLELKRVGFWNNANNDYPQYPLVSSCVDPSWEDHERAAVIDYLHTVGRRESSYRGMSICRCCGRHNGSEERTDGVYLWPSGFAHYLIEHDVKPPQDFLDHVWDQLGKVINEATKEVAKKAGLT